MFELISVGADPEVFLKTKAGMPVSAEGKIGGSKEEPKPIPKLVKGFAVQEDNVAAEFNIPPAFNSSEFSNHIAKALSYLGKLAKAQDLALDVVAAQHFSLEELATPHAQRLGCDPDMNAWTGDYNPAPKPPKTLRTAAGHVHIAWRQPERLDKMYVARACDVYLGIPSILATTKNERRALYGRAGAMRPKSYGVEYRALDNFWIVSEANRKHVFDQVVSLMNSLRDNFELFKETSDEFADEIQECINDHNKDAALVLMDIFGAKAFPENG